jgi:hypothetical protein
MKRSFYINRECVAYIIGGLESQSMSLGEIQEYLEQKSIKISLGELRSIISGLYFIGLIERRKTRKKSFKYQILKSKNG